MLDQEIIEIAKNIYDTEIKSLKSLICKSDTVDDFTAKINAHKRNIWRSEQGKISRTIAL